MCLFVVERRSKVEVVALEPEFQRQFSVDIFQISDLFFQIHERVVHTHELLLCLQFRDALSNLVDILARCCDGIE